MFNLQSIFKEVSLSRFNIYLALWLAVVLNVMFYKQVQLLTPYHGFKAYAFIGATILVVLAFYHLVFQLLQWRPMAKGLAALLIVIGGMSAYFVNSLGVSITPDQIQNMMQTDGNEVRDLLSWRLVLWIGAMVVLPLVVLFKVKIRRDPFKTVLLHKLFGSAVSILMIAGMLFIFFVDYAAIFREHRDLKGMISPQNAISSTLSYYKKNRPQQHLPLVTYGEDAHLVEQVGQQNLPKLMVLVVGETARAESFSLNGYAKKTNPELEKLNVINFNVMSAQRLDAISGLVAINSLMAMVGGTLAANFAGKNDPGFLHNGPLAGLVAICAGSDVVHPIGALVIGAIAGLIFVKLFTYTQNKLKIDDVLGVWPLHGVCGAFGGLAVGIFGQKWLGGLGGVAMMSQLIGTLLAIGIAVIGGLLVYGALKATMGIRLSQEDEFRGADLSIHKISANSDDSMF